jgi:hypothetical protein
MAKITFGCYPFSAIPDEGLSLTDADLYAALHPLLEALYQILCLIVEGKQDDPEMRPTLTLISGLVGLADEVLERWYETVHGRK